MSSTLGRPLRDSAADTDDDDDVLGARAATAAAIYGGMGASATDADSNQRGGEWRLPDGESTLSSGASDPVALQKACVPHRH